MPIALGQAFSRLDHYTAYRNGTGYVAKKEPCHEEENQQRDDGNKQTLPRCGNCQQTVELFTFFFRFSNSIMK